MFWNMFWIILLIFPAFMVDVKLGATVSPPKPGGYIMYGYILLCRTVIQAQVKKTMNV